MQVEFVKENPDGSAVYTFDMTGNEIQAMIRFGIIAALKEAIKTAQDEYDPTLNNGENIESK